MLQRLAERNVSQDSVRQILASGEVIHEYVGDKPFPSALFLGYFGNKPLHVVAAYDEAEGRVFVITVYEPSLDLYEEDYRTRKRDD